MTEPTEPKISDFLARLPSPKAETDELLKFYDEVQGAYLKVYQDNAGKIIDPIINRLEEERKITTVEKEAYLKRLIREVQNIAGPAVDTLELIRSARRDNNQISEENLKGAIKPTEERCLSYLKNPNFIINEWIKGKLSWEISHNESGWYFGGPHIVDHSSRRQLDINMMIGEQIKVS